MLTAVKYVRSILNSTDQKGCIAVSKSYRFMSVVANNNNFTTEKHFIFIVAVVDAKDRRILCQTKGIWDCYWSLFNL